MTAARTAAVLVTGRLELSRWAPDDLERLCVLCSHPDVARYIDDGEPLSPEACDELHREMLEHWNVHGFGLRSVRVRGGEWIGVVGLRSSVSLGAVEVCWWLLPRHWHKGYATEAARTVLDEAFTVLGLSTVLAVTRPENAASLRVMQRAGMTPAPDQVDVANRPLAVAIARQPAPTTGA